LVTSNAAVRFLVVPALIFATVLWGSPASAQSSAQARILSPVKNEERITVQNTVPVIVQRSVDTGRMASGQNLGHMLLMLAPAADQEQAAEQLVAALLDASSTKFHKWLTPEQFGRQFGVADEDAAKVQQWLQGQGLTVHEVAQSRRFVVFSGTVGQVELAFSTEMHTYSYNNKKFIANATDVQIPAALAPVVKGVVRLHSDPHTPTLKIGNKINVNRKTGKIEGPYGLHFMGPADFATIYNVKPLYAAGIDGSGQTIAIVSRSSLVDPNYGIDGIQDIRDFRVAMGLPANDPQMIINGDDPGVLSYNDTIEAMLDVTWAGAVAPMAQIKVVASQSNFADGVDISAAYIVDHNLAPVMSTSFGTCEQDLGTVQAAFYNSLWQQAAAQGITAFVSAGDNGGAGCDSQSSGQFASHGVAVNGIASTPYNVAVGGTQFDDTANPDAYWSVTADPTTLQSAISYIPEMVWNESSNDPFFTSLWAGSGGVSTIYAKPNWQTAAGVPNDGKRDLPDISLAAAGHTGYAICFEASCSDPTSIGVYSVGGTSASSPAAAGIMALVLQKQNGQPQGVANYVFYRLANIPGVYHDITKGNNKVPDTNGQYTVGYDAGPGYDLASGLGSFDANALVNSWATASTGAGSTTTLSLASGQPTTVVHGTPITFHTKVTCGGVAGCPAPSGEVSLLATSATNGTVGVGAGALTPAASGSTVNIASPEVPGGNYAVSARYSGDGKYFASNSNSLIVTVTPEATQMSMGGVSGGYFVNPPTSIGYGEPVPLWIVVAGNSGYGHPSGSVALLVDGNPANTFASDYQTAVPLLTLNYGEFSTVFGNGKTPTAQSSTLPNLSSGLTVGTHQLQATYPGDNSFLGSQASYSINITQTGSVIADVFLVGTAVPNVPVNIAGQIVLANNGCAPYGGTVTITDYTSGSPVVIASGPASQQYCDSFSLPVTFTTAGQHLTRVSFSGDSNVGPSTGTGNLTVNANTSSYFTNFSADVTNIIVGGTVNLTAQVGSDVRQYTPTGSVTFLDGASTLAIVKLDATGTATLAVSSLAAGTHNLSVSYPGDAVLTSSTGGPITEMVADYTLQAQPSDLIVSAGQSGTATISIIPLGGSTQTVQLSCGNLPLDISCTFSPASATLDGVNPASVKVTVNTRPVTAKNETKGRVWGTASTLAFAGLLLPFLRRKRLKTLLGIVAILVVALYGAGCGGGSGNSNIAATGTYVLNLNASAGAGSAAKVIPLVITVTK